MKRKILIVTILMFISLICISVKSNAAISATSTTVQSGETVSIKITSNPGVAAYTVKLENSGGLEFLSCTGGTIGGTSVSDSQNKDMKSLATYNFRVPTVTQDTTYTVTFSASGMETLDLVPVANSTATARITVKANNNSNEGSSNNNSGNFTKSNNANLSNLGIKPKEYDFTGFRYGNTKYDVTVPYEVETVEVYADVQDSKAQLTGTGNKKLKEGTNVVQVVVTAEDGTKKTYTINIVRNSETNEVVPNVPDESEENVEELRLTAIALQNDLNLKLSPTFDSEIFEYTVEVEEELEKLEVSGIPNINSAIVQIEGNNNLDEENNIITLTVSASGYEDVVYKIKVLKKIPTKVEEKKETLEASKDELDNSNAMTRNIVICAVAVLIIIVIIIVILKVRKKGNKYKDSYYEDDYYNANNIENSNYDNNETEENEISSEDYETPQGYTAEIETDEEYESDRKRRKGRGKHF